MSLRSEIKFWLYRWFNIRPEGLTYPVNDKAGRTYWIIYDNDREDEFPFEFHLWRHGHLVGLIRCIYEDENKMVEIGDLFVMEKHRNQGVGAAFLQWFIQFTREHNAIHITGNVHPEDWNKLDHLIAWYKRNGFTVIEKNGKHLLYMKL